MIRRLFTRALSSLVGDDPHPEPFMPADAMVEPVVVPELEPDPIEFVRMPPAVAECLSLTPVERRALRKVGRHALPLDSKKDARIAAWEFNGLPRPMGRHRAVQP